MTATAMAEWRCPHCRRLLCRCALAPGSRVEQKCYACNRMAVLHIPATDVLRESVNRPAMAGPVLRATA